jgi:hypothetical protein
MSKQLYTEHGANASIKMARSRLFNIDNGAGTTLDDCILRHSQPITLVAAQIEYTTETAGTVAGATVKVGTTVGGAEIVASTAYENSKTVGLVTALTLVITAVAANTPILVRHTGIATTALGEAYVTLFYTVDES